MDLSEPSRRAELKRQYLRQAIEDYEYSSAPEYDKPLMSFRAAHAGTLDLDYNDPERNVDLSNDGTGHG